jgi:hypothetical protein
MEKNKITFESQKSLKILLRIQIRIHNKGRLIYSKFLHKMYLTSNGMSRQFFLTNLPTRQRHGGCARPDRGFADLPASGGRRVGPPPGLLPRRLSQPRSALSPPGGLQY